MVSSEYPCDKIQELLDAYRDGEASTLEREIVERHLEHCHDCLGRLADIDCVVSLLKGLPRREIPTDLAQKIEALASDRNYRFKFNALTRAAVSMAAGAILLLVIWQAITHMNSQMIAVNKGTNLSTLNNPQSPLPIDHPVVATHLSPLEPMAKPNHDLLKSKEKSVRNMNQAKGSMQESLAISATSTNGFAHQSHYDDALEDGSITIAAISEEEQETITEALGIATDEDGLYAIKM